jgi:ribokinase
VPVDSTGAGDTFTAVLAVRLAEGESMESACLAANEAAGRSVTVRYVLPSIPYRTPAR